MCIRWSVLLSLLSCLSAMAEEIDFNRDIRPILSDNCFACHGFNESSRQAGLRLDRREGATADLGGDAAIVPGEPDASELIQRITTKDVDILMPPPDSHKKRLDAKAVSLLGRWIGEGAVWGKHWSFEKPVKSPVADNENAIDFFVKQRLRSEQLGLADRAAVHTLARRLSFDLTGLPPAPELIAQLGDDPADSDWNEWVDRLLDSPHFGERMAMWWLDGARYSDTDGFQADGIRTNWPWRDWVVDAFNDDMPFDQFTIEQFAGDLLPDATPEQKLATCFHRNHMNNGEGGRDPEESRVDYVIDRVNTIGTLWLGLTLGCTQCHDHKFDPISQRDYYSLNAYFNSIDETGEAGGKAGPYLKYESPYAPRALDEASELLKRSEVTLGEVREKAEGEADHWITQQIERVSDGFTPWALIRPKRLATNEGYPLVWDEEGDIVKSAAADMPQDDFIITASPTALDRITGVRLDVYPHPSHTAGKLSHSDSGEFILTNVKLQVRKHGTSQIDEIPLASAVADVNGQGEDTKYANVSGTLDDDPRTGWTTRTKPADVPHHAVFALAQPLVLQPDEELDIILMQRSLDPRALIGRFRLSVTDQAGEAVRSLDPMPLEELAELISRSPEANGSSNSQTEGDGQHPIAAVDVPADLRKRLVEQFLEDHVEYQNAKIRHDQIRSQYDATKKAAGELNVMVLRQREEPRETNVLERGVWDKKGEKVSVAVLPAVLPRDPSEVPTRLELGRWIVSRDNPLTARVITNQIWQLFFGAGLVRTPNDFGQQGESPTHPELLDWLAVDFMDSGWDLKHLVRTIVTSETYRQDSSVDPALQRRDPENRLLARGARFRLPSWMIRDAMLASSGLLNPAIGGPPIFPYQPPGVWKDQFMGRFEYKPSVGPAQYRRTLYAFWRRTSAPTFLFDTAMRRTCEVVSRRTNTPLHALTLLNDTTSLQASKSLAELSLADDEASDQGERLESMFRRVVGRQPDEAELAVLLRQFERAMEFYREDGQSAVKLVRVDQLDTVPENRLTELAAGMLVANMILNLDEAITHE